MASKKHKKLGAALALAVVVILALIAVNCSGDNSQDEAAPRVEVAETAPQTTAAPAEAEEAAEPDDSEPAAADMEMDEVAAEAEDPDEGLAERNRQRAEDLETIVDAIGEYLDDDEQAESTDVEDSSEVEATEAEDEEQLDQAAIDCRNAKLAVVETYRVAVAAHMVHAEAYDSHIDAHHVNWGEWQTWGDLLEAQAAALQAEAAAAYAQVAANEACADVAADDYEDHAACAASGRSLLALSQEHIGALIRLHDAEGQDEATISVIEAEVGLAWAEVELAAAELERGCSDLE